MIMIIPCTTVAVNKRQGAAIPLARKARTNQMKRRCRRSSVEPGFSIKGTASRQTPNKTNSIDLHLRMVQTTTLYVVLLTGIRPADHLISSVDRGHEHVPFRKEAAALRGPPVNRYKGAAAYTK